MQDRLLRTVSAIYATVGHEASWNQALGELCRSVDAHGAMLTLEAPGGRVLDHHQHGFDETWLDDYARDWAARSPYLARFYTEPGNAGRFLASEELLPYEDWVATEMFNESARLMAVHHGAATFFATADCLRVRLSCVRDRIAGAFERDELRNLDHLVPHITQALRIGRAFPDPVADRLDALDERGTPAMVLGRDLTIIERNGAARRLLDTEPRLRREDDRLWLSDQGAERRVAQAARECCGDARRQRQILLPAEGDLLPLSLLVSRAPARPAAFDCEAGNRDLVLLTVVSRDRPRQLAARQLRELFDLTPA